MKYGDFQRYRDFYCIHSSKLMHRCVSQNNPNTYIFGVLYQSILQLFALHRVCVGDRLALQFRHSRKAISYRTLL